MFAEFEQNLVRPEYWLSVLKIIWIDILLSGDNALVIALACRNLPDRQRNWGMILGAGAAVTLRVLFATIIVVLMTIPYLKLVGGLALLVIAAKLLVHGLLAVTDGEQRKAAVEQDLRRAGAVLPGHRGRAAGEDYALRFEPVKCFLRGAEGSDLAVNASLAHPAGDELGHLAAEVDDEKGFGRLDGQGVELR